MTQQEKYEALLTFVKNMANNHDPEEEDITESDEFNPYDMSGGNFDDAFWMGVRHGYWDKNKSAYDLLQKLEAV